MEQDFRVCRICYILILCLASSSIANLTNNSIVTTTQDTSLTLTEQEPDSNNSYYEKDFYDSKGETTTQATNHNFTSTTDLTKTSEPITSVTKEKTESQTHGSNKTEKEKSASSDTKIVIIFFTIFIIVIVIISVIIILKKKNKKTSYSFESKCKSTDDTEIPLGNMKE